MILNHIGNKWFKVGHTLQLIAFAAYIGGNTASASYVPDLSNQPVWQSADEEPSNGPDSTDYDTDGLPAWYETWLGTDPISHDTDGDGINDGDEVATTRTHPLSWDTDGNGQSDLAIFMRPILPPKILALLRVKQTRPKSKLQTVIAMAFRTISRTASPSQIPM